jgi:hypothetical protein
LPLAHLIKSEIEKSQFIKKIAIKMKVSEDAVWSDLKKIKAKEGKTERSKEENFKVKDDKEALLFEAEKYGLVVDKEKTNEEILRKIELADLKKKLQETAISLDDESISKEEEKDLKTELEKIQKRIKELSN